MGPRMWATIGNIFKISAVFAFLGGLLFGYQAIEASQHGDPQKLAPMLGTVSGLEFLVALLFWNIKGPLIRGNVIARVLFGGQVLLSVVFSFGISLIYVGIVYLFTSEPASYDYYGMFGSQAKEPKPRFKAPADWRATGQVGPSGATIYSDDVGGVPAGGLVSYTPVQVMEKRNGLARVVAATGESGWIDTRVLTEAI